MTPEQRPEPVPLARLQESNPSRWGRPGDDAAGVPPLAVEVTLPASGTMGHTDDWFRDPIKATQVNYRAHTGRHAQTGEPIVVVSVTAYSARTNKSWMDPRHFVATGLDSSPPPSWVPEAPEWFWNAVDDMTAASIREAVASS